VDMSLENMDLNRISVMFNSSQRRRGSYPTHRPGSVPSYYARSITSSHYRYRDTTTHMPGSLLRL
jgi:hypothetical protein